jgi:hypothetical protein
MKDKVEIVRNNDCGNSPKNKLIQELSIGISLGLWAGINQNINDETKIRFIANKVIEKQLIEYVQSNKGIIDGRIDKVEVISSISHGKTGAGNILIVNEDEKKELCFMYELKSAGSIIIKIVKVFGL